MVSRNKRFKQRQGPDSSRFYAVLSDRRKAAMELFAPALISFGNRRGQL
jgi:hypothetical protein